MKPRAVAALAAASCLAASLIARDALAQDRPPGADDAGAPPSTAPDATAPPATAPPGSIEPPPPAAVRDEPAPPLSPAPLAPSRSQPAVAPARPTPSTPYAIELATLTSLRQRGAISQAAYDSAVHDLASTNGEHAGDANTLLLARFATTLYGFVEADAIVDSTQSFNELAGNALVARPGTYPGSHPRAMFGVRNSRLGLRIAAPEIAGIRASALLEMDFLGNQPATATEAQLFTSPTFRVRHFALKLETPVVDLLFGQTWQLFGWQSQYHPNTVGIQGVPGQLYSRTPQIRISRRFHSDAVDVEIALAAMRPPQRDSATPEGQAGIRLAINHWTGVQTTGATGTSVAPFSIAITGDLRRYSLTEFSATPMNSVDVAGWGVAADLFVPIVPSRSIRRGNALSLTAEAAYGYGIADLYTGLTGGIGFPTLPNPMMTTPAPTYTPDVDPGLVTFDSHGAAQAIQWTSFIGGLQYYLPAVDGRVWISANYSRMMSSNAVSLGTAAKVRSAEDWADANVFVDVTQAVRLGFEYALFVDHYGDGTDAVNHRGQFSAYYRF